MYFDAGGQRFDWLEESDAMCLSIENEPVKWGDAPCQIADSLAQCNQMFIAAGCDRGIKPPTLPKLIKNAISDT